MMMSVDRSAVARIYEDIKKRILGGELRLRERIDLDEIATSHKASTMPVRQALAFLTFERLVVYHPTRGHYVTLWSERALQDLYEWRGMIACMAAEKHEPVESAANLNGMSAYADAAAFLLQRLNTGANAELARAATNADERLRAARLVEPEVISGCETELDSLEGAMRYAAPLEIQALLRSYHERRVKRAAEIRAHAILHALPEDSE